MASASVLSGMRPTGAMHIGHYHGALKNWVRLQDEHPCYFFVADWHALTTAYDETEIIEKSVWDMLVDWLAAGLDPEKATIFIQSRVIEHAELALLLGMATPLGWLERMPTYKDQIARLSHKDLTTYGFLGYPLMQSADILIYKASYVPVGEDQVPHIEITREVARRFNSLYGREPGFEDKARAAMAKMGKADAKTFDLLRKRYQQEGDADSLEEGRRMIAEAKSLGAADRERLTGYLTGSQRQILVEPAALLTESPKVPGLDGTKMSKSYGNAIGLREDPVAIAKKIRVMPTDPARVRRTDPGTPEKCPVWALHQLYTPADTREQLHRGCTTAAIGCLDCKQPLIDGVVAQVEAFRERAQPYLDRPATLREMVDAGCDKARATARETMREVRQAMGLAYV